MNALQLLRFPWHWTYPSLRWSAVIAFVLSSIGAIAAGVFVDGRQALASALMLFGAGLTYLWAFFFSLGLLVSIDAHKLRLPGIQRRVNASLVLYGLLSVAVPLLAPGFHANMAAVLALFCVAGLAFALMPRYLALLVALAPSLINTLWQQLDLPGLDDPRLVPWAALVSFGLLLICTWRWRQLVRSGEQKAQGWSSPMVLQFRHGSWGHWNCMGDSSQWRQRPAWLQAGVDLADAGPARPRKAMQVMLGGWYLPQTVGSYAKRLVLVLGIVALPTASIILLTLGKSDDADFASTLAGASVGALGSLSMIAAPAICIFSLLWLSRRWQHTNAELPLLALLPGLGAAAELKRRLLRAALGLPLALHALLALLMVLALPFWHGHAYLLSFMLLAQLGAAVVTGAVLVNLLGGQALSPWHVGGILLLTGMMTMASVVLPALAPGRHPVAQALPLLPLGWLLLAVAMARLGHRGWRALMQRPHPFLAD